MSVLILHDKIAALYAPAYAWSYNQYVFLHENSHFLFKIILKIHTKTYQSSKFSKISSRELPHCKRVSEIFMFYLKNGSFNNLCDKW